MVKVILESFNHGPVSIIAKYSIMTRYKSEIGLSIVIPLSIGLAFTGGLMAYEKVWAGFIFILLVTIFIAHMLLTTSYVIDNNILRIKCGFLFKSTIEISSVKRITESNNALSSPAASLNRLEIVYNKYDRVLISPKHKTDFLNEMISLNPGIEIRLKSQPSDTGVKTDLLK